MTTPTPERAADPTPEAELLQNLWYDGLFIINKPPRPSTDDMMHDRSDGPSLVLNVTDLPTAKATAIMDAHNLARTAAHAQGRAKLREEIARWHEAKMIEARDGPTGHTAIAGAHVCVHHDSAMVVRAWPDAAPTEDGIKPPAYPARRDPS